MHVSDVWNQTTIFSLLKGWFLGAKLLTKRKHHATLYLKCMLGGNINHILILTLLPDVPCLLIDSVTWPAWPRLSTSWMTLRCSQILLSRSATLKWRRGWLRWVTFSVVCFSSPIALRLGYRCSRSLVVRIIRPITRLVSFAHICMYSMLHFKLALMSMAGV